MIMPALFVVFAEHVGHLVVTSNIVSKDLMKEPGLERSLLGDGLANILSGFFGATPNTTYGENIGVLAITRCTTKAYNKNNRCKNHVNRVCVVYFTFN